MGIAKSASMFRQVMCERRAASTSKDNTCFDVTPSSCAVKLVAIAKVKRAGELGNNRHQGRAKWKMRTLYGPPELRRARMWHSSNGPEKHDEGLTRLGLPIQRKAPICLSQYFTFFYRRLAPLDQSVCEFHSIHTNISNNMTIFLRREKNWVSWR
jgi:hypothetical protein